MTATRIVLGTAALGQRYGLARPDGTRPELSAASAAEVLRRAAAAGVRRIDTAPAYGEAEARIGASGLAGDLEIWTKVSGAPAEGEASLARSLERLGRRRLDGLQWHNWSAPMKEDPGFRSLWRSLAEDRRVGRLGATTYGPDDARAAAESGLFSSIQVEWNVLNPTVVRSLGARPGVEVQVRSVYLQGALTDEGRALPPSPALAAAVGALRELAAGAGMGLTELALRAALSEPGIDRVVLGIDAPEQLDVALAHERKGPLPTGLSAQLDRIALGAVPDVDPRRWATLGR